MMVGFVGVGLSPLATPVKRPPRLPFSSSRKGSPNVPNAPHFAAGFTPNNGILLRDDGQEAIAGEANDDERLISGLSNALGRVRYRSQQG